MAERPAGKITDEGVARLRERIGVPEPWTLPPHYQRPEHRRVPHRRRGLRRRQPALVRSGLRREVGVGRADRVAADGGRRHADRRGRGHRGARGQARPHEGRPAARGARVLLRERPRVVGAVAARPPRLPAQRAVAVLDKPSEFAERAMHEWTANVFRDDDGTILSGQYRLMIRTEREKAQEKKKYDDVEFRRYTDDEIDAIDARVRGAGRVASRRRAAVLGGRRRVGDAVGPMVKGPLTVTDMVCWHVGMGMGLYGVRALDLAAREPPADPAVLPPRRAERARRDAAGALGSRSSRASRGTPPRSTTGACARRG